MHGRLQWRLALEWAMAVMQEQHGFLHVASSLSFSVDSALSAAGFDEWEVAADASCQQMCYCKVFAKVTVELIQQNYMTWCHTNHIHWQNYP